ncbi:uncharacterized protein DUF6894 [Sphingomonas sp. F9_3S_D5_B_2]
MGRYFFHLVDGTDTTLDPEGVEMADDQIAADALRQARSIIAGDVATGEINLDLRIEVRNQRGELVHRLPFAEAVKVREDAAA